MVAAEQDEEILTAILEHEPQGQPRTALEELGAELTDPEPTVRVRTAEGMQQIAQCQQALGTLLLW